MLNQNLDFATLNKDAGNETWNNTFTYWLLLLRDLQNPIARQAKEACAIMSFQYDIEDQAEDEESLIGDPDLIPAVFIPIAPVTLALEWSPFPAAINALGNPLHFDTDGGETLAIFTPATDFDAPNATPDERHFGFLLQHACKRAINTKSLILLVGSPGWSYASEDFLESAPDIQELMKNFGFVYTLRKPQSS
ncbi:hypothetical protein [Hymenobacter psoromatis]|uniref:hypothetical protein n=1 Tax=Hymenobacter psoromatis TaxID=1484116 RepID=UPI001CBADDBE|nr:hypothetical protein [Hymenobacter psoromatis]